MRGVSILANGFHQFFIRKKIEPRQVHRPRFRIRSRIIDRDLQIDMPKVPAPQAFGHVQCFGLRVAAVVQPTLLIKTGGLDHEGVAVPPSHRIAHINGQYRFLERAAIQEDLTPVVV